MARPTKKGVDQLLLDVGIFGDNKIRILLSRYHADGLAVYLYILCDVYKEGYYKAVEVWEDYMYVIADEIKASSDKVQQIIAFMCNRAMLTVFKGEDVKATGCNYEAVITSHGIQKRYAAIMKSYRRKSIEEIKRDFWLLTEEEEREINALYKNGNNAGYYGKNPNYYGNNPDKSRNNPTYNNILYNSTDVPRARANFFKEFPQVKPKREDEAAFEGIDFDKLAEKFRQSKKLLQTRRAWSWVSSHYERILAGEYDDFPEAEKSGKPAPSLPPAVEAANARSERERWYSERRNKAESRAEKAREKMQSFSAYYETEKALRRLEIEHAKAELYEPEKVKEIELEQDAREFERAQALLLAGLTEADLLPVWYCPKCSDTGFLPSGAACDCFDKAHSKK